MNFKHYSIYPFKKQIAYKCKNSCVRRDVCKSPIRASIPSFFGYIVQNLGGGENSALEFMELCWKMTESWCWKMTESWCWKMTVSWCWKMTGIPKIWLWINTLIPFVSGMNIHVNPAILMFTRGTRFWHTAILWLQQDHGFFWCFKSSWFNPFAFRKIAWRG